jgi:hypothetical protein
VKNVYTEQKEEVIYYAQVVGLPRGYLKEVSRCDISTGWLGKEPCLSIEQHPRISLSSDRAFWDIFKNSSTSFSIYTYR